MIGFNSLRIRLLAGALVWISLALGMAGFVLADLFHEHVRARLLAELATHLDQLTAALDYGPDGEIAVARQLSDPRFERPLSGLYWQAVRPDCTLLRSRSLWDSTIALPRDALSTAGEVHEHELAGPAEPALVVLERNVVPPGGSDPVRLAVAIDRTSLDAVTAAFDRTLVWSLVVLAVSLLVAAFAQVQVGLRPLGRLRRELAAIRSGAGRRFEATMPSEIEPLVQDLNLLLDHSEEVVARSRLQAGNLAHALKTRLAVLGNEARALSGGSASEAAARINDQVELMRRHVDYHMARARAAAARSVPGISTPVAPVVAALARTLERLHALRSIEIVVAVEDGVRFGGEREDLDEMLGNVMDNACKWGRHKVRVTGRSEGAQRLLLLVEDDGPGLPPERHEEVLAPGVRLDENVPGAGLGLAVVRDLAQLYGGTLRLGVSQLGGLRVELDLPAARP